MSELKNLGTKPTAGAGSRARRLLVRLAGVGVVAVVLFLGLHYADVATESDAFCGTICHANFPEYVANKVSEHTGVQCSTCHIGPGVPAKVMAKVNGVGEMMAQITNSYERPITPLVEGMRPGTVICGQCHVPEEYSEYRVHYGSYFAADEPNSETQVYVKLRVGGDITKPGETTSVHWHVDNPVSYVAFDRERQDIPWVSVVKDGQLVEYKQVGSLLADTERAKMTVRTMDCTDCHSRPAHEFRNPDRSVDEALATDRLDRSLPYLKREAVKLLSAPYSSRDEAMQAMAGLEEFYRTEYPALFAAKEGAVAQAVGELRILYSYSVFPDMSVTWDIYPNNIGHTDSLGCFRCHDGLQVSGQGEVIPDSCDTCHVLDWLGE
jgi:hypothetical protein